MVDVGCLVVDLAFLSAGVDYKSTLVEPRCYAAAYMNQFFGSGANFWTCVCLTMG